MKVSMKARNCCIIAGVILLAILLIYVLFTGQDSILPCLTIGLFFFLHFIFPGNIFYFTKTPGNIGFTLLCVCRYLLIPILMMAVPYDESIVGQTVAAGHYKAAWILYIYELVVIEIVYFIAVRIIRKREKKDAGGLLSYVDPRALVVVILLLFGAGAAIILINPSILSRYHFALSRSEIVTDDFTTSSALFVLLEYVRILIPILIAAFYQYRGKGNNWILIIAPILFTLLFYTSTSRNSIFIPGVAYMFMLIKAFPKYAKRIFVILSSVIGSIVLIMTMYKSFYGGKLSNDVMTLSNYLSTYVMGPKELAIGFATNATYSGNITFRTLINDLINNFPILSRFSDVNNITGQYYNWTYYSYEFSGGGFIIPAVIQGLLHFGYALSPLFVAIKIVLMVKFDSLYKSADTISSFFYARAAAYLGLFIGTNISLNINMLAVWILVPITVIYISSLFTRKRKAVRLANAEN